MRYFFDTEFYEDGRTIDLISIGIVSEDGREFYAENVDFDWSLVPEDHWIQENVRPHLWSSLPSEELPPGVVMHPDADDFFQAGGTGGLWTREVIADEIVVWVEKKPEFWAYYADYDWVVLCQLFGRMIDLPEGWPMYCRDLKQLADHLGNPRIPKQQNDEHHALADARYNVFRFECLQGVMMSYPGGAGAPLRL